MTIRHLKIFLTVAETGKMSMPQNSSISLSPQSARRSGNWKTTTRYCSLNASPKNFISLKTEKNFMSRPNSL